MRILPYIVYSTYAHMVYVHMLNKFRYFLVLEWLLFLSFETFEMGRGINFPIIFIHFFTIKYLWFNNYLK